MQMKPLNPDFTIQQQLAEPETGPLVLVNIFALDTADEAAFMQAWSEDAAYMKARPGFISAQLHRAVGDSPLYFNHAVWESLEAFRATFSDPGFQAKMARYPSSTSASPHLFKRVAVPGICVA